MRRIGLVRAYEGLGALYTASLRLVSPALVRLTNFDGSERPWRKRVIAAPSLPALLTGMRQSNSHLSGERSEIGGAVHCQTV
jgi:hypothetical protein